MSLNMEFSERHIDLLDEALRGKIALDDPRFLEWLEVSENNRLRYEKEIAQMANEILIERELDTRGLWKRINKQIRTGEREEKRFKIRVLKYVAAIALPLLVLGGYWMSRHMGDKAMTLEIAHQISPGGKIATLTLSTGEQVDLNEALTSLKEVDGTRIGLQEEGKIVYENPDQVRDEILFNTVEIPVRGEYSITLADGTRVWLASASELKFPVNFAGDRREVYLKGEAFFEVAPDKEKPFIVACGNFSVKALGTSFNIMNYSDEVCAQATLSTGKVEVTMKNHKQILEPGQQAMIQGDNLSVREVNMTPYTSWMKDRFYFSNEELQVIMRKIARWYGVEIVYSTPKIMEYHFTGNIPKYSEISKVFELLGLTTNVNFQIQDNTIIISDR